MGEINVLCNIMWHALNTQVIVLGTNSFSTSIPTFFWYNFNQQRKFAPLDAMAPHSSTLAWKIPWTEEPGRLQSMGSLRVGHDGATSLSLFTFMHWRRKWLPTPLFVPGESQGRGSLVGPRVYGVAQSRARLKWLSSSSSSRCSCCQKWYYTEKLIRRYVSHYS